MLGFLSTGATMTEPLLQIPSGAGQTKCASRHGRKQPFYKKTKFLGKISTRWAKKNSTWYYIKAYLALSRKIV